MPTQLVDWSPISMTVDGKKFAFCIAIALLIASAAIASAQQPPKPAPAQHPAAAQSAGQPVLANEPQRTTATYGDWVVQCVANSSPPPDAICDMSQVTQVQPVKLIVQVPVNVSFATQVHIQTGDDDPGVIAPFANCNPNGCFAEFDLRDDLLKKLYGATSAGKMSFADAGNHAITVPMSFNGFSQAFDALSKK
jgi:invasion protein IalB